MILAGDIGGTKSLFALFQVHEGKLIQLNEKKYLSRELKSLENSIKGFLEESSPLLQKETLQAACFSVAGPVYSSTIHLVNLDLTLNLDDIRHNLSFIPSIDFCNDLQALGYGLSYLQPHDLLCLYPDNSSLRDSADHSGRQSAPLNKAIIAPGTGLGEALIMADQYVYPTEGGHTDFGPQSEEEVGLWRFLQQEFGHVSYERVISGPGLMNIYRFLRREKPWENNVKPILSPEEISQKALAGTCPICQNALDLFVRILGAEAGNLALKSLALGGVYLGGGIPPKIIPKLQEKTFLDAFQRKGRFSNLMQEIPIYVILNERTPLYGAALLAAQLR